MMICQMSESDRLVQITQRRGGLSCCAYSIWNNPDLLTKAELFLKSHQSAEISSAVLAAATAVASAGIN